MMASGVWGPVLTRKLRADLWAARWRWLAAVLASALGVAVVLALLLAQARLRQDMQLNYLGTAPASAQVLLPAPLDPALLAALAARPGLSAVEAGATLRARVATAQGPWRPALLFVVPEQQPPSIGQPTLLQGRWLADAEHLLVERDALGLLGGVAPGELLRLSMGDTDPGLLLRVSASVHDPALAPASTEGVVYGWIGAGLLARLPGAQLQALLNLRFADLEAAVEAGAPRDEVQDQVDRRARAQVAWLAAQGVAMTELRVPPIGNHPHGFQASSALALLVGFGGLALVTALLLSHALQRGWLEQQAPQIGVLRLLGAGTGSLLALQVAGAGLMGLATTALALPIGLAAGQALVTLSQGLMNLRPLAPGVPLWWWALGLVLGLGVPLLAALLPLRQVLRQPPRLALGRPDIERAVAFQPPAAWPLVLRLALLEGLRRWRRLGLTVALLGVAGAVLVASLDLRQSWADLAGRAAQARHWQLELRLARPAEDTALLPWLNQQPGLRSVEAWNAVSALWVDGDQAPLSRTYPDGGHGQMLLRAAPPASVLWTPALLQGRLLGAGDAGGVLLNRGALALRRQPARLGDKVTVVAGGRRLTLQVLGVIDEPLTAPTAYVLPATHAVATGLVGRSSHLRLQAADPASAESLLPPLQQVLAERGVWLRGVVTDRQLRQSANSHVLLLVHSLAAVALCVALVGLIGLGSALGSVVAENRRAMGVMRALGATPGLLTGTVLTLALLVVAASLPLTLALVGPVASVMLAVVGRSSGLLLQLAWWWPGPLLWTLAAAAGAVLAAAGPARQAQCISVREALAERG